MWHTGRKVRYFFENGKLLMVHTKFYLDNIEEKKILMLKFSQN